MKRMIIASEGRPQTRYDYKLTPRDVTNLRVMFEGYEYGVGRQIARKLWNAERNHRTDVSLDFTEKDFAGYLLENPYLSDEDLISLEKLLKWKYKEMFDDFYASRES